MDVSALFNSILPYVRTKSELAELNSALDLFLLNMFSTTNNEGRDVFSQLPRELADILRKTFLKQTINLDNRQLIIQTVKSLQEKLGAGKFLQITLAFEPSDSNLTVICDWVRREIDAQMLLDITVDKKIDGGAIIVANGLYKDYSLRKTLLAIFSTKENVDNLLA
jgi:F0F1-type ATP synthase delta subunit